MDTIYGWCSATGNHLHKRHAISYEKSYVPPKMESRGTNVVISGQAYHRYFVVWVCDACTKTWWVEDHPQIVETAS